MPENFALKYYPSENRAPRDKATGHAVQMYEIEIEHKDWQRSKRNKACIHKNHLIDNKYHCCY